ncbi:MAG TPA: response regulator [Acidobacteriota bacterium]|nr:response regulator [Acidobacteriota bacterium]
MMYKILIVDDEQNLRLLYKKEFEKEGYEVILAKSGEEALRKFQEAAPHLVILDIKMPGLDGVETMSKMLSIDNKTPVILNTAYASYQDNFTTWAADAYVVKSSDMGELRNRVREILAERYGGQE